MTAPEGTTVTEVCKLLANARSDAALLTGANGSMTGIVTAIDFIRCACLGVRCNVLRAACCVLCACVDGRVTAPGCCNDA